MAPAIILAATFSIGWIYVWVFVPRQVESMFRYRLWRLRDELQDRIFDETVSDVAGAEGVVAVLEAVIQHSDQINLARYLSFKIPRRTPTGAATPFFELSHLSPEERTIISNILDEFDHSSM